MIISRRTFTKDLTMNLKDRIHRFRRFRKMKRDKPHFWHLEHNKLGWIQNYKVGTNSIKHSLACNILEHQSPGTIVQHVGEERVAQISKQNAGFYTTAEIKKRWGDYYIFAFVRNPLDRLYSCYANKVLDIRGTEKLSPFRQYGITKDSTFEEFVHTIVEVPDEQADRHFRTQLWFVSVNGELITKYIGKLETFHEDWQPLEEQFGLHAPPHRNQSSLQKARYCDFYTAETWKLALKRYECDIETFNYGDILKADQPS